MPCVSRFSFKTSCHFFCSTNSINLSSKKYFPKKGIEVSSSRLLRTNAWCMTYYPCQSFTLVLLRAYELQFNMNLCPKYRNRRVVIITITYAIFLSMFYNKLYIGLYYQNKLLHPNSADKVRKRYICKGWKWEVTKIQQSNIIYFISDHPYQLLVRPATQSSCPTPTRPASSLLRPDSTRPFHAVCHPSRHPHTSGHQANGKYQCRASYHSRIVLSTSFHQSIQSCRCRASYCFAIHPRIFCSCTTRRHLNKRIFTLSVDLVIEELALIVARVQKFQDALASFGPILVLSFVLLTIGPLLHSESILLVVLPLSHILSPIGVSIGAVSIGLVIEPLALVDISIGMIQNSLTIGLIIGPLSHILRAIGPSLCSIAFTHAVLPFTLIGYPIIQLHRAQFGDLVFFEGRLDKLVIFGSLTTVQQIDITIIEFPIPVSLGLWLFGIVLFSCSCCSRILLFLLLFIDGGSGGAFFVILFGGFYIFFGLFLWYEFLILYGFIVAILALKHIALQVLFDLLFIVGVDFER